MQSSENPRPLCALNWFFDISVLTSWRVTVRQALHRIKRLFAGCDIAPRTMGLSYWHPKMGRHRYQSGFFGRSLASWRSGFPGNCRAMVPEWVWISRMNRISLYLLMEIVDPAD
jgi:hypothetical protein